MSTLIQKLAVFIFWPLDHAHVIGHVSSVRHTAVTQYMWQCDIVYTGTSPFPSSFFVELEGTEYNRDDAKPTRVF